MKTGLITSTLFVLLTISLQAATDTLPATTLDALHEAGAVADEKGFLLRLTENCVFLGMDSDNRLEGPSLRDFIRAQFSSGVAWNYRSSQRDIRFSADGTVAWFHETLQHDQLGRTWGSGVLVRSANDWRVAQYNLGSAIQPTDVDSADAGPEKAKGCNKIRHKTNRQASC